MKILLLSDNFPPEGNAPATRLYEHATRWVDSGHEVTVITCAPNFPEGRVFDGYKNRWYSVEDVDGIRVVRVKTYITANEGFVKRTLDYVSFMVVGFFAGLFQKRPDLVVATSPQFFAAIGGWALAKIRRLPFVFEVRDLWPASIVAVGAMEQSRVIRWLEKLELFLYRQADAVVPVTHAFKQDMVGRGINQDKIEVVLNGVDLTRYAPAEAKDPQLAAQHGLDGKFVVGYLGTHGMAHGLDKVLEAASLLRDNEDVRFVFAGSGAQRDLLIQQCAEQHLHNVIMLPRQPKEVVARFWSLCDVALIPLRDDPVFSTVIPSKLFEAMGMGVPILMSLPKGEATSIVEDEGVGITVQPDSPALLAEAVKRLKDDKPLYVQLKEQCAASAGKYSRDHFAREMTRIFDAVVAKRGAR